MLNYTVRRVAATVPVVIGVFIAVFLILHVTPGDPARLIAGDNAPPETVESIRRELGLDQPVLIQLGKYLGRVAVGDLGRSVWTRRPVWAELAAPYKVTLQLVLSATLFSVLLAVPAGVVAAVHRGRAFDKITMMGAVAGYSLPSFWIGLLLMLLFGHRLQWLPMSGWDGPTTWLGLKQMVLPTITLSGVQMASIARLTRSCMLEVLGQDYVRTARAKGLSDRLVVYRHALRNAALPVVTIVTLQFGFFLGGAVVTETLFAVPGIGRLAVDAIALRDFPVVQGVVLLFAMGLVLATLFADLLYQVLDPRIRYE